MRDLRFPVLMLATALLLSACSLKPGEGPRWGNLRVTLEDIRQTESQWTASLVITNPTEKMQALEYQGPAPYTLVVTRDGKEVLRQDFNDSSKPGVVNLAAGVARKHVVVWTYRNSEGQRVEPGTYEISVTLNAVTRGPNPDRKAGQPAEVVVGPKTVGPIQVKVE